MFYYFVKIAHRLTFYKIYNCKIKKKKNLKISGKKKNSTRRDINFY